MTMILPFLGATGAGWHKRKKERKNYFSFHSGHIFICYLETVFLSEKDGINKEFFFLNIVYIFLCSDNINA